MFLLVEGVVLLVEEVLLVEGVLLFEGVGGFLLVGVGLLIKNGAASQFRGIDRERALSSRCVSGIWVRTKTRGSVSLLDQSTRTRRNGERDILERGWELEPCPCWELSFVKVSDKLRRCMRVRVPGVLKLRRLRGTLFEFDILLVVHFGG